MELAKESPKRAVWKILVVVFLGLIILAVLSGYGLRLLGLINAFNPMVFLESFWVLNNSEQSVEIIPIGMIAVSGRYGPLPRYKNWFPPAVPILNPQPIILAAGAKTKITYDYDDINFRHILVKDKAGKMYIVDTDKKGTKHACYGPQKDFYIISALEQLRTAPDVLIQCFYGQKVIYPGAKEYPEESTQKKISK